MLDDLRLDDAERAYEWGMVLADDLRLGSVQVTDRAPGRAAADIILDEQQKPTKEVPTPANDRHLLVRVLSAQALDEQPAVVETIPFANPPQRDLRVNKLRILSRSTQPDWRMLLFPYRTGTALPTTTWDAGRTTLTLRWDDQTDTLVFTAGSDGRTRLAIHRDGAALLALE